MDPRYDPTVKVIPGKKAKSAAKSKDSQNCARSFKRLTSRDEARSMISNKKAMIEDQFKSPYMNTAHSSRKKSHAIEKNSVSNIKLQASQAKIGGRASCNSSFYASGSQLVLSA